MNRINFYLQFFIEELWQKKWSFLLVAWAISIVGIIVVILIPDQYRTKAGISIDTDKLLSQVVVDSTFSLNNATREQAQKVSQIIYSTDNLKNVLRNVSVDNYDLTPTKEIILVEEMRKNLNFVQMGKDYYEMSYTHSNPETAYKTLKEILNIFVETNIKQLSNNSDKAIIFSEDALKMKRRTYANIQKELAEFKENNLELIDTSGQLYSSLRKAESFVDSYRVNRQVYSDRVSNLTTILAQTSKYSSVGGSIDPSCDLRKIIGDLAAARARGLTDSHPDVMYLNELLSAKRKACPPETTASRITNPTYSQILSQLNSAKSDLAQFDVRYEKAQSDIPELRAKLSKQPEVLEKLEILEGKKDKAAHDLGLADRKNDMLQETLDLNRKSGLVNYDVIQDVIFPVKPEKPNHFFLFIGCFLASLIGSAGLIILKVQMEQRMPTVHHLREAFSLPILGSITKVNMNAHHTSQVRDIMIWSSSLGLLVILYFGLIYIYAIAFLRPNFTWIYKSMFFFIDLIA